MAKGFRPEQVINGTWGEVWFDGEYLAQITACKAEVGRYKWITCTIALKIGNLLST